MKKLSARRRHPLAAVVVLLLALAATGGLYAVFAPADKAQAEETSQSLAIDEGKKLYADGLGGFRNSDTVVVTPDGIDVLTEYPKDLESLTIPV